jgi:phosphatidylglycerophosphate synthase
VKANNESTPDGDRPSSVVALIPNLLSLARVALGFVFPWIAPNWRVAVVVAAALSDLFDGLISRRLHATSTTGRILDPIADKLFVICVLLTLLLEGSVKTWQLALVASRDLAVVLGSVTVAVFEGWSAMKRMPPSWLGKITTAAQFAFLLTVLHFREVMLVVFVPTAAVSVLAGVDYLRRYRTQRP